MSRFFNGQYFNLVVFCLFATSLIDSKDSDTICLPSNNVKWNKNKEKCEECPKCAPGMFRNLTEPYTRRNGSHGAERCLKCRPCPEGTYSMDGSGECRKCRMNCTKFHREVDRRCNSLHDNECGSCLTGYVDIYKTTSFPCGKLKIPRRLDPPPSRQEDEKDDQSLGSKTQLTSESSDGEKHNAQQPSTLISIVVGIVGTTLLLTAVFGMIKWKRRQQPHQVNSHESASLTKDTDLEMDGIRNEETEPKTYLPKPQPVCVRSELECSPGPQPRPELSGPQLSHNYEGIVFSLPDNPNKMWSLQWCRRNICSCNENNNCKCQSYVFPSTIKIQKGDAYVVAVATHICHDPLELFRNLNLGNPTIFQESDSRDRNPEVISLKDLVTNLLHRWIEIGHSPRTLHELSAALCKAHFHNINDILYKISEHDSIYPETNSLSSISLCSVSEV